MRIEGWRVSFSFLLSCLGNSYNHQPQAKPHVKNYEYSAELGADFTARGANSANSVKTVDFHFWTFDDDVCRHCWIFHTYHGLLGLLLDCSGYSSYWQKRNQDMADRRRVNGPPSGTRPTVFASSIQSQSGAATERPRRQRQPNELRKICE